jgi:hypothetical protein
MSAVWEFLGLRSASEYQAMAGAGAAHHASQTLTIGGGGTATLGARSGRTAAVLKAAPRNAAPITVEAGAYPLEPGGVLNATAADAYSFAGTVGDVLYVYEEWS